MPILSLTCFCNDNQQNSGSDAKESGNLARGAYIHYGQLCVAASRVADPQHFHFTVNDGVSRKTWNVVYKEIL